MHLEPGQTFPIEYGNGKTCDVKALSLREKVNVAAILAQIQASKGPEVFPLFVDALEIVCPGKADDPAVDDRIAGEIIGKALAGSSLSSEQEKKSE
jgi:hypothetical protein